jgi:hypothetical protein
LVLIAIDKRPFHLAFISNLEYFSLSSSGVKLGIDVSVILNSLNRKSIPTLFIPLTVNIDSRIVHLEYSKYKQLDKGQSCLTPIKKILATIDDSLSNCQYAYDLIPLLYRRNLIEDTYSINFTQSSLELTKYGQEEIDFAIYNAAQLC